MGMKLPPGLYRPICADSTLEIASGYGSGDQAVRNTFSRRIFFVILAIHTVLLAWGASRHSPAFCEAAHLPAGLSHWKFGRFELYRVNPPLVRMVAALPVLFTTPRTDWTHVRDMPGARPEFLIGEAFISANGTRAFWLFTLARWACLPFSLLGAVICFAWARDLYGDAAGIVAIFLWCFCPEVLAYGQLITPDVGSAALGVTSGYVFWRWLRNPNWWLASLCGIVLGLTELTRSSWIILFILWPALWLTSEFSKNFLGQKRLPRARSGWQLIVILSIALYVLNLGYGFEGTGKRLGDYVFVSKTLSGEGSSGRIGNRFKDSDLGSIRLPFPSNYVRGIDEQKRDFESFMWPSYLRGEIRETGWWYFYLYGLFVKMPLGMWVLFVIAIFLPQTCKRQFAKMDACVLLSPMLIHLILVSSQTAFSIHFRYVLPALPFGFIWTGRVANAALGASKSLKILVIVALSWTFASSLSVYPHSLSYFNEIAGGPNGGPFHMVYSAHDWGQDLLYLKRWMDKHPEATPMKLACYAYFDPRVAGLPASLPPPRPEPGWYAISTTLLQGIPWRTPRNSFDYFRRLDPIAKAGYSINIYHLDEQTVRLMSNEPVPTLD